jgi:hypothetical protein
MPSARSETRPQNFRFRSGNCNIQAAGPTFSRAGSRRARVGIGYTGAALRRSLQDNPPLEACLVRRDKAAVGSNMLCQELAVLAGQ